jgi:hypothetical protein
MSQQPETGKKKSFAEAVEKPSTGVVGEFFAFLKQTRKWWLLPILGVLLIFGVLIALAGTAAAPFIYTLF